MTHAQPPSGPDIAPDGPSSAGPSRDMREQFAVLAAIDPATADTHVSGIAPTPTEVVADTRTALANTGDAGGPRYTFEAVFGAGGLGQIRRAFDHRLERHVALKELRDFRPGSTSEVRFRREALLTARLEHPSIVPIHDIGKRATGEPYYCMKLVDGQSLDALVRACSTFAERIALVPHVLAIADALAYAHDKGIIHRDLKPANVLVGAFGETVVIDWGLAKELHGDDDLVDERCRSANDLPADDLTRTGEFLGTLPFMPPEQAEGGHIDARADVYAIGAILYFVLSGFMPYEGRSTLAALAALLDGPPPDLSERVTAVPEDLLAIVRKAMAYDREARYASAKDLAADLRRFQAGRLVTARPYSPIDLLRHFVRRHRGLLGVATAALVLLAAVGIYSYLQVLAQKHEADDQRLQAVDARALAEQRRDESEARTREAKRNAADLLVEAGRQELFIHQHPQQGLVLLHEAHKLAPADPGLPVMLREATRAVDAQRLTLPGHGGGVAALAYSPSGHHLLANSIDGAVHLWDLRDGHRLSIAALPDDEILAAAFAAESDDEILAYTRTGRIGRFRDGRWQTLVAVAGAPDLGRAGPKLQAFGPGAALLTRGMALAIVDPSTGSRTHNLPAGDAIWVDPIAFTPGRSIVLLTSRGGADVRFIQWNLEGSGTDRITSPEFEWFQFASVAATGDGRLVSFYETPNRPFVWDVHARTVVPLDACGAIAEVGISRHPAHFEPGGRHLVRLINDHIVARWDVATGACTRVVVLDGDVNNDLKITPDGRDAVVISQNAEVSVLDLETLTPRLRFLAHTRPIRAASVGPTSDTLATGSEDGEVRLWTLQDPRILHTTPASDATVGARPGEMVVLGIPQEPDSPVVLSRSPRLPGAARPLMGFEQLMLSWQQPARPRAILRISAEPSGEAPPEQITLDAASPSEHFASAAARRSIVVTCTEARGLCEVWSIAEDRPLGRLDFAALGYVATSLTVSPDEQHIWVYARPLQAFDRGVLLRYGLPALDIQHITPAAPTDIAAVTSRALGPRADSQQLLDLVSGAVIAEVPGTFANFSPAGDLWFVRGEGGDVRVHDTIAGEPIATLRAESGVSRSRFSSTDPAVHFSSDGELFVAPRLNGTVDVWSADTLESVRELKGHVHPPDQFVFSPDGTHLLTYTRDAMAALVWDLDADSGGSRLDVPDIEAASFSPDGRVLATGSSDGAVRLWGGETPRLLAVLQGHRKPVSLLEFSPSGERLISAADGDRAIVWQVPHETRTSEQLDELIATKVPFHLVNGQVVRR